MLRRRARDSARGVRNIPHKHSEDRIHTVLTEQGGVCCPSCDTEATMTEEGLGHLSRELLGQW